MIENEGVKRSTESQNELTPREREVLELVARGSSSRAIAEALTVSVSTAERHVENIRLKLEARNRVQMVARALKLGLLRTE